MSISPASHPGTPEITEARIYEVADFVAVKPGESYVQVHHYRSVYHPDGRINQEVFPTSTLLEQMIRAFHGKVYESAGTLSAFFEDPDQARACASAIWAHHHKHSELCGSQLTIAI